MILRLALILVAGALMSSCEYPFGHSGYGQYYGGQSSDTTIGSAARNRVPTELQRERGVFQ